MFSSNTFRLRLLFASAALLGLAGCQSSGTQWQGNGSSSQNFAGTSSWSSKAANEASPDSSYSGVYSDMSDDFWSDGPHGSQNSLSQISFATEGSDFDPEIDPSGTSLVYASTQHATKADLYRKKIDGKTITRLTSDPAEDVMPAISSDGKWIAFASDRSGNWDIWMMPFSGGPATQMTFDSDHELHPSFSPDGSELTYCRRNSRSGSWEIWSYRLDSPGTRTYVCDGLFPQWCPDGSRSTLLFQRARQRGSQFFSIWTVDFSQGECSNPTEIVAASDTAIMHPNWSPNGELICYCTVSNPGSVTNWPTQADVWMVGVDGSGQAPLTQGVHRNMQPTWSKDGRIFFVSDRGGQDVIWAIPAASSTPVAPGSRFATVDTNSGSDD
jgi:TolB protein